MAARSCAACGGPLPSDAQFCGACGAPIGGLAGGEASAPSLLTGRAWGSEDVLAHAGRSGGLLTPKTSREGPSSGIVSLGTLLGVEGLRSFLLQHELLSGSWNYRILDRDQHLLFSVRGSRTADLLRAVHHAGSSTEGGGMPTLTLLWSVLDASNVERGRISIEVTGNRAVSTLRDTVGAQVVAIRVERGVTGGLSATSSLPDGRAMFHADANVLRHNFSILDPSDAEVAVIHEAWASLHGTYALDIVGHVNPLGPLVCAILIDREKRLASAGP